MKNPPKIINKINTAIPLPCLPQVLIKLNQLCNSEAPSTAEMARLVAMDPALTAKILRLETVEAPTNSSLAVIEQALERLGPGTVKNVALFCLSNPLSNPLLWKTDVNYNQFWFHSLRCAVIARCLSEELLPNLADDAYISGLLHDVGKLLLWTNFKKDYEPLFKKSIKADSALPAENDSIGTNHCEAGWNLIRTLKVHPFVADAVLYHHFPVKEIAAALPIVKIVSAANAIGYQMEGKGHLELIQALGLDLKLERLDHILAEAENRIVAMLEDLELTPETAVQSHAPSGRDRGASFYGIFGEFRELSIRHLTVAGITTEDEPLPTLQKLLRSFRILFDIGTTVFFYYDPGHNVLVGKPAGSAPVDIYTGQIELPVSSSGSLPSLALTRQQVLDSFGYLTNDLVTIADDQLIRLLNTEGMLCIPLLHRQKWIGVICAGIDEPQFPLLWEQLSLLNLFASQAAPLLEKIVFSEIRKVSSDEIIATVDDDAIRRVIHEVNNPLGIVKNYLNVLSSKIGEHPGVRDEIGLIREEIERIPGIIAQLSKSRYKNEADDELLDINSIVYDLSKLLTKSVLDHANISLNFSPDPALPPFSGKKSNLVQVFINLLKNSVEAMPGGGNIFITTAFESDKRAGAGGDIVVTIRDDGPGMPEEVLKRLFEPGISSKGPEHFGLGLSISRDIINRYNGDIRCESRKEKGTTFRISLPVSDPNLQHGKKRQK